MTGVQTCALPIWEAFPEREPGEIKILDVGTGPGFFAILLAEAGYQVTAVDYTEEMLREAQQNAGGLAECIVWKTGDAQALDVESNSFDVIVTRNVTWNLPRPDLAYKEWLRVLKPGGVLYNFDADWYGHLYNEEKRSGYEKDRQQTEEQNVEDYYSGTDIEKMEEIARQVPLSRLERPKWDLETMRKTGFLDVSCDDLRHDAPVHGRLCGPDPADRGHVRQADDPRRRGPGLRVAGR